MSAGRAVIELRYAIQIARRYSLIGLKLIEKRLFWPLHRRPIMVKHRTGASLLRRPFADLFALVFERTPSIAGWPQRGLRPSGDGQYTVSIQRPASRGIDRRPFSAHRKCAS
jgi:hypothetical protein